MSTKQPVKSKTKKSLTSIQTITVPSVEPSARFQTFVSRTIYFETGGNKAGAYTNDPKDSGSETKWGISKTAHPSLNIKTLTYKDAVDVYFKEYFNPLYQFITDENIAFKLFDMGVLFGVKKAISLLQDAISDCGITIKKDGRFGPMTLTAVNISPMLDLNIYKAYIGKLEWEAKVCIVIHPFNLKFYKGWINRINASLKDEEKNGK